MVNLYIFMLKVPPNKTHANRHRVNCVITRTENSLSNWQLLYPPVYMYSQLNIWNIWVLKTSIMGPIHQTQLVYKAHESWFRVSRNPPASLFGHKKYPRQNFKNAKIIHYFSKYRRFRQFQQLALYIFNL